MGQGCNIVGVIKPWAWHPEERPDLDTIYMTALQVLTREGGGWPLSVFLAPDTTPFYAGTYFPPDDRYAAHGKPSFRRLLAGIIDAWQHRRDKIAEVGQNVADHLSRSSPPAAEDGHLCPGHLGGSPGRPGAELRPEWWLRLRPEVPARSGTALLLLPREAVRRPVRRSGWSGTRSTRWPAAGCTIRSAAASIATASMKQWLVPHFEKMLYDNALLTSSHTWRHSSIPATRSTSRIVRETLDYVLLEMTSPVGAFFSTQDADSEGEEGKFYVWSEAELRDILGPALGEFACQGLGRNASAATSRGTISSSGPVRRAGCRAVGALTR
jgi:hypothetical protein